MAAAATRDDAYFALHRGIFAHNNLVFSIYMNQVRMGFGHTHKGFFDDIIYLVDEFLHNVSFSNMKRGKA